MSLHPEPKRKSRRARAAAKIAWPRAIPKRSLGWSEGMNQDRALKQCGGYLSVAGGEWVSANDDREDEHDGREPHGHEEPDIEAAHEHGCAFTLDQTEVVR